MLIFECDIFYYRCFLNKGSKLKPNVSNRRQNLLMMLFMNLSDIAILNNKDSDYSICESEAINLMQNVDLTKKALCYRR